MHSSEISSDGIETTYHHNGDYSGKVLFQAHLSFDGDSETPYHNFLGDFQDYSPKTVEVAVPFEHMKVLVAQWARLERISELEQMSPGEILGVD
jgi:hypothetical protein